MLQRPLALAIVNNEGEEPCFVGEMAHFGGGARSASLRCSGPTYVLDVPSGAVDTIMQDYPGLTQILCKQLASRLQEANEALTHGSEQLAMDVKQLDVAAGEVVVRAGEPADVLYQLLVGSLIVEGAERPMKPRELPMKFIDPEPYFADGCHQQTILARTNVMLVGIQKSSRLAAIRNYPELMMRLTHQRSSASP